MYKSVSIDNVIAKILRDTRMKDSTYVSDFYEWIPEAMALMNTNAPLVPKCFPVKIGFHMGKLPCGLLYIDAVEYQNKRLRYYNGVRHPRYAGRRAHDPGVTLSEATVGIVTNQATGNQMYEAQWKPPVEEHPVEGYQLHLDHIATTFEEGEVLVHCHIMATDQRGLPLIPDHQDYKEALYWYVRMKMIQSGFIDPMYKNDDRIAYQRWELHATRAISDIIYPTPDQKEAQLAMHVRFIPPTDYYTSFFNSTLGEPPYGI